MPLYEFRCPFCEAEADEIMGFDDPPLVCSGDEQTPHGPTPMQRLISTTSFQLKGKGWPDQDRREFRARINKRNARIAKMTPTQQEGFRKIVDGPGGVKYVP